jgi:hypothetical protein
VVSLSQLLPGSDPGRFVEIEHPLRWDNPFAELVAGDGPPFNRWVKSARPR